MLCSFSPFHGHALTREPGGPADLSSLRAQEWGCQVGIQPRGHKSDGWGCAAEGLPEELYVGI